ncbi:exopolysaccharide biosynthesis protein [Sulfitobacter sp. S0837]|uniref:exopolysaccharide biosynthesis protein n=1 Tax=Sulfitobacter maritimus TaxID=2741719 RepID=UPI001582C8BA|nr:exopolysaccharide biosynthesis protein [Sulfitobacter maritimus]NUH67096.1 exopolysaccharide biosynthesis protein [Sulfitobacter maritimus]
MRRDEHTLHFLLDSMDRAAQRETVSIQDILHEIGDRSITPLILIVALLLVSPLSGIPGVSTLAALTIIILAVQAVRGKRSLWLPGFLLRREIAGKSLSSCVGYLRRPCAFVDRQCRPRLQYLTTGPMRFLTLLMVAVIPIGWPFMEVLPMMSSIGALTVALLVFGLFTRDGLFVLLGYLCVAVTLGAGLWLLLSAT